MSPAKSAAEPAAQSLPWAGAESSEGAWQTNELFPQCSAHTMQGDESGPSAGAECEWLPPQKPMVSAATPLRGVSAMISRTTAIFEYLGIRVAKLAQRRLQRDYSRFEGVTGGA